MSDRLNATITIREVTQRKPDFVKLKDNSGKVFNCAAEKLLGRWNEDDGGDGRFILDVGRHLDIAYHEYEGEHNGKPYVSKYIDSAHRADAQKPNTWPDKEPFGGGGGGSYSSGGNGSKSKGDDFRSKQQVNKSHTLHALCVLRQGTDISIAELLEQCEVADNWVMGGSLADKATSNGGLADYVKQAVDNLDAKPDYDDVPF